MYFCIFVLNERPHLYKKILIKLGSQGVLGPGSNIGQVASTSDLYIYICRGRFRILWLRIWDIFTCRHMLKVYYLRTRTAKFCALSSHDTLVSNLISALSHQFNHKLRTVSSIYCICNYFACRVRACRGENAKCNQNYQGSSGRSALCSAE